MLHLYNTRTREKAKFVPLQEHPVLQGQLLQLSGMLEEYSRNVRDREYS